MSFGWHMQLPTSGWLDSVALLPQHTPVKAVNDSGMLVEAKQRNPGVFTVLRKWYDGGQIFGGSYEENKQRARVFFDTFVDGTFMSQQAPFVDAIEDWNEYFDDRHVPNVQRQWMKDNFGLGFNPEFLEGEYQQRLTWIQAVNQVWTTEYRTRPELAHIRLVTGNVPIGNSIPLEFARVVAEHGGLMGYHNYIYVTNGNIDPGNDLFLSGRWKWNDAYFKANGVTVEWIGTEGGVYGSVVDGWKAAGVCGGNLDCYKAALHWYEQGVAAWNAQNGNRWRGGVLFTTFVPNAPAGVMADVTAALGYPLQWVRRVGEVERFINAETWQSYHLMQPQMNELAAVSAQYPIGGAPPPPPPPPPPPGNGDNLLPNWSFEGGHTDGATGQVANGWNIFWHEGPLQVDGETVSFFKPESRVMPRTGPGSLPPEEGYLILDGDHTVKVFKGQGPILFRYSTQPFELAPGRYRFLLPFYSDLVMAYDGDTKIFADDPLAGEWRAVVNGQDVTPYASPFPFGRWHGYPVEFEHPGGPCTVGLRFRCRWGLKNNGWFMDAGKLEKVDEPAPPPPPPGHTWNKTVYLLPQSTTPAEYDAVQAVAYPTRSEIAFSADSAFARPGNVTGHTVVVYAVSRWGGQAALEAWLAGAGYVYEPLTTIEYREFPAVDPTLVDGYDAPVGTDEERPASAMWPGKWIDANPFLNHYQFGDPLQWAYHTGADLNLNDPVWNMDANAPARAVANGTVTYARLVPTGTWGRLVVIRHKNQDETFTHSRYGHLRTFNVVEGQTVKRGDVVGSIGGSEYGVPDHLHFDISTSGILETEPKHWPGDNKPLVQQHYVDPKAYIVARRPVT